MPNPLADEYDLEDMWRPLAADEVPRALNLIDKASALLRQVAPHVDQRIAAFAANPADPTGLDPTIVATVVATIVKRFISNVEGIASQSVGGFSISYALRSERSVRGELQVTADDLNALRMYRPRSRIGTIRVRAALAPNPLGGVGGMYANSSILATGLYDSQWETEHPEVSRALLGIDGEGLGFGVGL
jgi:hypothetical protein